MAEPTTGSGQFWRRVRRLETVMITKALLRTRGNVSEASRDLGLDRVTLIRKIRRYHLRRFTHRIQGRPRATRLHPRTKEAADAE